MTTATPAIVEWAPFRTGADVDRDQLLAASQRLEADFLSQAEGYLGRVLLEQGDGAWTDLVFWRDAASAEAAMAKVADSAACASYFACMHNEDTNEAGNGVLMQRVVARYGAVSF